MKICPKCKAEIEDHARFCLSCMTSLDEKAPIPQPAHKRRLWPFALIFAVLALGITMLWRFLPSAKLPQEPSAEAAGQTTPTAPHAQSQPDADLDPAVISHTVDGVTYTFRPATREEHPSAVTLDNHFALIQVEGTPPDGIYRVPTFVGNDTTALVTVITDGAFTGSNAKAIDLGHNVRYVWGNAFGGHALTDLYLHEDVLIDQAAFSDCTEDLTIHCPEYLENTKGTLWSALSVKYGFRWQPEDI